MSKFRDSKLVNIREFYEKNGQLLPGRKGIEITYTNKLSNRRVKRLN